MTTNQLAYHRDMEAKRANLAKEQELLRSHLAQEFETNRSNVMRENETMRHNRANEEHDASKLAADTSMKMMELPAKYISSLSSAYKVAGKV